MIAIHEPVTATVAACSFQFCLVVLLLCMVHLHMELGLCETNQLYSLLLYIEASYTNENCCKTSNLVATL